MNSRQRKILNAIFSDPVRSDIAWSDIERLLKSLGAEISEGRGSRVRIALKNERGVFHRPHPQRVTDKGAVQAVRDLLNNAGCVPQGDEKQKDD